MQFSEIRKIRKILIIQMRYIGDVILTTPLLRTLKNGLPGVQIHLLVNRGTQAVLASHPHADRVLVFDYETGGKSLRHVVSFVSMLRKEKYDAVIDLTGNDRSALFARLSGARLRIGYAGDSRLRNILAYSTEIDVTAGSIHTVDHHLKSAEIFGLPVNDIHPFLAVAPEEAARVRAILAARDLKTDQAFVILHPGARRPYKSWPLDRFALLGDHIIRTFNIPVLLSGSGDDQNLCAQLAEKMKEKSLNLAGQISLADLPALIQKSCCLIGNDSAPIHIATAVNTPVIALFGPTKWEIWGPRRRQDRIIAAEFPCRPCGHSRPACPLGEKYCMTDIAFETVRAAVSEVLGLQGEFPVAAEGAPGQKKIRKD
ncbi:MAG: putative lipopolysaccharide heptosyltransferase III [Desulfobacterales bacterium]